MAHKVTATLIVAKLAPKGEAYFSKGAVLPPAVPLAERKRLVEAGLVELVKPAAKPAEGADPPAPAEGPVEP